QYRYVVHVLDRDASISVRQSAVVGELADYFGRSDQTRSAKQHLERDDGCVKHNRKILLQAAHGETSAQEHRHAPMGKERDLKHAVGQAEFPRTRAKTLFDW